MKYFRKKKKTKKKRYMDINSQAELIVNLAITNKPVEDAITTISNAFNQSGTNKKMNVSYIRIALTTASCILEQGNSKKDATAAVIAILEKSTNEEEKYSEELEIDQINSIALKCAEAVMHADDEENNEYRIINKKKSKNVSFSEQQVHIIEFTPDQLLQLNRDFDDIEDIESITSDDLSSIVEKDLISDIKFSFATFLELCAENVLSYSYDLKNDIICEQAIRKIPDSADAFDIFDDDISYVEASAISKKGIYILETAHGKRKFVVN